MVARTLTVALLLLAALALVAGVSGCSGVPADKRPSVTGNLVENGDFEQASPGMNGPEGWYATVLPETEQHVTFEWDDAVAHSGERCVSVAISDLHPEERVDYNWTQPVGGCRPGETYELRAWVKPENLRSSAFIVVQCWNVTLSEMLGYASTHQEMPVLGTTDWTPVRATFTVPEDTHEVRIRAGISCPMSKGGKAWFDDVKITPVRGT